MRHTLRKTEILRGYRAFSRIISEGYVLRSGPVRCFIVYDKHAAGTLLVGFSVSRSAGNAVIRNRIRRWMREAYRKNKELIRVAPSSLHGAVTVVLVGSASTTDGHTGKAQKAVEHAVVSLLRELHHHLGGKP